MQITTKQLNPTKIEITADADEELLARVKTAVLKDMAKEIQISGFRKGHAPAHVVEKAVDQNQLQSRFLDGAVSEMYANAVVEKQLRPVGQPNVSITKYVPFSSLEVKIEVAVVGEVTLPDYEKFKHDLKLEKVEDKEVERVIDDLLARDAEKKVVEKLAADGDEVVIDFKGVDAKTGEAIAGAEGEAYPLIIGSNTFIPGFEPELIGLKTGDEKTFDITFPKDYGSKELQEKKVTFTVRAIEVKEIILPKLDENFVAKVGPFKTVAELRADIKKQIQAEKDYQAERQLENDVLMELAEKSKVEIPELLIEDESERMIAEEKRNILYRGQTWQEYLASLDETEEDHRKKVTEQASLRVKSGIVLGEVAQVEKITVEDDELQARLTQLKQQYASDKQMSEELEKPENVRDIASRILTEKTIQRLVSFTKK